MNKIFLPVIKTLILLVSFYSSIASGQTDLDSALRKAGFRASRILSSYPNNQFPSPSYWYNAGNAFASKFSDTEAAGIWIVSLYISNGITQLNFPSPGGSFPYINFITSDKNEEYLTYFDNRNLKVWLQVEPGAASIDTLIYLVLNRYKHHPCVIGFGVDVEWYNTQLYSGGKKVTDEEAQRWESKVKAVNPNYTLFLKHYGQSWMPPSYRGNILFVDDSQIFSNMTSLINEFKSWGQKFYPNPVAFQYGYSADKVWWSLLPDPMKTIGQSLINNIPNCKGLFWVDFTINDIFPITSIKEVPDISNFMLYQNYPNPFNPSTTIKFELPIASKVILEIFNITGEKIADILDREMTAGIHTVGFNSSHLPGGVYFYKLSAGNYTSTRKLLLIK